MKPLYQIANDILLCLASDDTGELPVGMEARLDDLQTDLAAKIEGCCCAVRNLEAEHLALLAEANRFKERAQVAGRATERLRDYIRSNLERIGIDKMDAGLFKVRLQANSQPSVKFDGNPDDLDLRWVKVTTELDKAAVIAAFKDHQHLPDGVSVVRNQHLRIV